MTKVLFVNHKIKNCGVYQFGKRVANLSSKSTKLNCNYIEVDCVEELKEEIIKFNPDVVVYNWHIGTMSWLTKDIIKSFDIERNFFIYHQEDMIDSFDKYLFFGDYDPSNSLPHSMKSLISRPLFNFTGEYPINDVANIGSFGFGFHNKGFDKLVSLVNSTFSEAVINLHMPPSYFGDPTGTQTREVIQKCLDANKNPNITLNISQDFKTDDGVLLFLANNDINVFVYEENGDGISSVIDYALSVKRPIAISESRMFRHLDGVSGISIADSSLKEIINRGVAPLEDIYKKWSNENFIREMEEAINE